MYTSKSIFDKLFLFLFIGATVEVLKEENTFQGLFFTTHDMRVSLKAWGETIYFDGTYKLLMHSLIVLLFLVEDGNFLTEIAGVGIVRREDQATMDWIMASFKKHHYRNIDIIKYFMSDKNATQRNSVQKFFPNVTMLICLFHTIQIFKRQLRELNITKEEKEFYFIQLKKLAYAENVQMYEARLLEMVKNCPDCILSYFFTNWDNIKKQWTCYNEHFGTFYNRTNNRTESINQKLKQIIDKLSNLSSAITLLFTWKNFHDEENKRKIIRNFGSVLTREQSEDEQKYVNLLMDGPADIVLNELKFKDYISFDNPNMENSMFTISKTNRETSFEQCNCIIWIAYQLPCRHIFAVRTFMRLSLYEETLCANRWTKQFCRNSHRIFMKLNNNMQPTSTKVTISEKIHSVKNKMELQIIKVDEIISDLIDVCSCYCGIKFHDEVFILLSLIEIWTKNPNVYVTIKPQTENEDIDLEFITKKFGDIDLNINKESNNLSVPEKRKIIITVLQDVYQIVKDEPERCSMKLFTLEKIREAWMNAQQIRLQQQQYLHISSEKPKVNEDTILLPQNFKTVGKPRHFLITNSTYKRNKK